MICNPGDVVISNRQLLHGSFANTSENWRVTKHGVFTQKFCIRGIRRWDS